MASTKTLTLAVVLCLTLALVPEPGSAGNYMWEEDFRMICSESGVLPLPKKLTIRQVIDDRFFTEAAETNVGMFASYLFRWDIDKGKVVVNGLLLKPDGREIPLPRLARRMKLGDAEKHKPAGTVFEPGDIIEWEVKLKGLPPLEGFDCWTLEVGIVCTDTEFAQSGMMSISGLRSFKK